MCIYTILCTLLPSQTLYSYPDSFRAYKVLIAAQYSGAAVTVVSEPPHFELGKTNKSPDFLAKFPLGKVNVYTYKFSHVVLGLPTLLTMMW